MKNVRWGLLSTAAIGETVLRATKSSLHTQFVAVASRDASRARDFAHRNGLPRSFDSYEAMLDSDEIDAVYVALPVSMHTEWTINALHAGKHVLCEKPCATGAADAKRCHDAADIRGLLCVEGLMYRHHPWTVLARKLVEEGAIGGLSYVRAALSVTVDTHDIRRTRSLGGGSLLDLGCYCASAMRLFAGEPDRVYAERVLDSGNDPVDLRMAATLHFPHDVLAQFDIGLDLVRRDELEIIGTRGKIIVDDPWLCRSRTIEVWRDGRMEEVPVSLANVGEDDDAVYRLELDRVSAAVMGGCASLLFGRDDAVKQAALLEALMESCQMSEPVRIT